LFQVSQFTDVQMEDLRASFALFDQDGDGHITTSELTAVMKCLGQNPTDAEILAIIKEVDADGEKFLFFFLNLLLFPQILCCVGLRWLCTAVSC